MSVMCGAIEVDVPISAAYTQWARFEELPRFMQGIARVEQLGMWRLRWHAEVGGVTRTWDAEIVEQEPDRRIAWRSTSGTRNNGVVLFTPLSARRCRVSVEIDYQPDGVVEAIGAGLGVVDYCVERDLECFKRFLESGGVEQQRQA
jgi:uncharacterized membrane protein